MGARRRRASWRCALRAGGARVWLDIARTGAVLALAYPDRVAKRRVESYTMVNGRAAAVDAASPLAREPFLVIADVAGAAGRARALLAAPISIEEIEVMFSAQIEEQVSVAIEPSTGAMRGRRVRRLGAIVLSEAPLERMSGAELGLALLARCEMRAWLLLDWDEAAAQLRARVTFMRALEGDAWPDWSDGALSGACESWLAPALENVSSLRDVCVADALLRTLPYDLRKRLEAQAPARFETPAGSSLAIDYAAEGGPALDVRLQEMFG